ncbi:MAG TPA: hypothetical protein VN658_09385 [Candidatus Acidoferrales bacterium]|nr:hypothetical protein [Candidatus Acidoferrales bacterium]
MRSISAVCRVILAAIIVAGSTSSAQILVRIPGLALRPMLFQGTPGFSTTPPSPIDLGPSAVGVTTPHAFPQPLQINNPGTAPLSISGSSFTPFEAGFTAESLFLPPISINPGSTRGADVLFFPQGPGKRTIQLLTPYGINVDTEYFFPQGPGKRTIQLSIIDNAPGSPHMVEFTGTGVAVAANDIGIILDPAVAMVNVPAGGSTTFPIWLLAGMSSTNTNVTVQCTGGPGGTLCGLDHNTTFLTGDSFGSTRDKILVTVSVPARSALGVRGIHDIGWAAVFAFGIVFAGRYRRTVVLFAAIAALLIASILMISCGGSSGVGGVGSSNLVITATPSPGTPHSLNVPLVVQ